MRSLPEGLLSALKDSLKNEYTKQILRVTGVRKASLQQRKTPHYRMPVLEQAGGWMRLDKYKGPEIPASEWEDLTYTTYSSDPTTYFAPITSATGEIELKGFWEYGKADLDGIWTSNAEKCPTLVKWIESIGARHDGWAGSRSSANPSARADFGADDNEEKSIIIMALGWVAERFKAPVLKTGVPARAPWVRIPPHPPAR